MNLDEQKLKLERQRLAIETILKRRDQQFQRHQFEVARGGVAAWTRTPVGAAVIAAIVALFGTVWNGHKSNELELIRQEATSKLERQRLEGTLILEAIRTAGAGAERERQAAANLLFLSELGLITLPTEKLARFRGAAANALPSLPIIIAPATERADQSWTEKAQDNWDARLSEIERLIADQRIPEAIHQARAVFMSPGVPPNVGARAKELHAKAVEDLKRIFEGVADSTENTITKPK